jgi:chromosome segregation ATPase
MNNLTSKITTLCFGTLLFTAGASAQRSAQGGLAQLSENVENAEYNFKQYEKSIITAEANIIETQKALDKTQLELQKIENESNHHQRLSIKLNQQKKEIEDQLKKWQVRAATLNSQKEKLTKDRNEIMQEKTIWVNKKKNYEKEAHRWSSEKSANKTHLKQLRSLAESPD